MRNERRLSRAKPALSPFDYAQGKLCRRVEGRDEIPFLGPLLLTYTICHGNIILVSKGKQDVGNV